MTAPLPGRRYTEHMAVPAVAVTTAPLSLEAVIDVVSAGGSASGAVASFSGLVRDHNQGRTVTFLEYEAYVPLAVKGMERIVSEAGETWPGVRLALHHRIGRLDPGEASIVIAAAGAHRADTFSACRYAIERVKQIVPIWKREHFEGGDVWLEGATADPEDEAARAQALRVSCA